MGSSPISSAVDLVSAKTKPVDFLLYPLLNVANCPSFVIIVLNTQS